MTWSMHGTQTKEGDLVQLVGLSHKHFLVILKGGEKMQSHRGVVAHDDLIGVEWGTQVYSHNGHPFFILQPSIADLLSEMPRCTQIMYPKDVGFLLMTMGIGPGSHVLEAGTGSGGLTSVFAYYVGSEGRVYTYEAKEEHQRLALKNLNKLGLADRVVAHVGDIGDGFAENGVDALFLDVPNPYDYIRQVKASLKSGGFFGSLVPTTNQVSRLVRVLRDEGFLYIQVVEIFYRFYKPEPDRLRPVDRMVAHTGFLIFARPMILTEKAGMNPDVLGGNMLQDEE
ncbi:MAG: tRNA (adenine-N1)-methyltransferase [Anaerolineae bacterium]|nr:tRNA (adenine-N1)-methyltransferase [Anaerolineae bacterium]